MPLIWHWGSWEHDPRVSVGLLQAEWLDAVYTAELDHGRVSSMLVVLEEGWVRLEGFAVAALQKRELALAERVEILHLTNCGCCPDGTAALF